MSVILASTVLTACSEVEETTIYDNWPAANQAFIDSIASLAEGRIVPLTSPAESVDRFALGEIFALQTRAGTTDKEQYVYCKKIEETDGEHPLYTDAVSAFYYGTYITGDRFDGNFLGYSATDRMELAPDANRPTEFDSPTTFNISSTIEGWIAALQYMRVGERWMLYIPYESGYGTSAYQDIPGYSTLTFDIILDGIER